VLFDFKYSKQFSFKDLACYYTGKRTKKSKRNHIKVDEILSKRKIKGGICDFISRNNNDKIKFYKYFRISIQPLTFLHSKVQVHCDLTKQNATVTEAVTSKEKLALLFDKS
jgi:hypothetical protein